jgi:hypothetical protein
LADSEAVRSRRKRLHAAGDHSMCRRCAAVRGDVITVPEVGLPPGFEPPSAALTALPSLAPPHLDPVAELRQLAAEALAAYRADTSNAILLRECRATLALLLPKDAGKADADLTGLLKALG